MSPVPPGWVARAFPSGALCVPRALADRVSTGWFDPHQPGAQAVTQGGRQAAWFVDGDHGPAVLRQYRRGGLLAWLRRDTYCWLGAARVRAWAEVRVLAHLQAARVAVPQPLAAAYWRTGFSYRNAILVGRIFGATPLAQLLDRASPLSVANAIRAMHDAGVWHADLNAYNILLDPDDTVWLIDFDRATIGHVSSRQRHNNLRRLRRSLLKVAGPQGAAWAGQLEACY